MNINFDSNALSPIQVSLGDVKIRSPGNEDGMDNTL